MQFTPLQQWRKVHPDIRGLLWEQYFNDYAARGFNEGDKPKIDVNSTFVLEETTPSGKKFIGAVEYYPEDPSDPSSRMIEIEPNRKYVYVGMVKGIIPGNGSKMMVALLDKLRSEKVDYVQLLCSKDNTFLLDFYQEYLFEVICSDQDGYAVMNLTLTRKRRRSSRILQK